MGLDLAEADDTDPLGAELAAIDAVLERTSKVLEGAAVPTRKETVSSAARPALVSDLDWDEDARLAQWQDILAETRQLPWSFAPRSCSTPGPKSRCCSMPLFGPLLVGSLLRQEGVCAGHLVKTLRGSAGGHEDATTDCWPWSMPSRTPR
ncbi:MULTISPECIES: DUF1612 domain-containing protein [unclassified Mesorhizobium]|nr:MULTISPECIES: DUF1612 domain-containing protein [unclassified Mesorhizobium]